MESMEGSLYLIVAIVAVLFVTFAAILSRYKRCPSDKILVVYGRTGKNATGGVSSARCIHGGAAFIWPVFQSFSFLDLTPISIECNLTNALSKQNIRVDVPCRFTVGISTEPDSMTNAAERLLGQRQENIQDLAKDILFGQLRLVIATMDIEEINSDRDKFLANVSANVEAELRKIGLKLINVNVTDLRDESGYIEALGKEAAAKAINDAKKSVAEQNRFGEIGKAEADRDKDIRIAETVRDTRIRTAEANATAVEGENNAKILIADSDAIRREREAEAAVKLLRQRKCRLQRLWKRRIWQRKRPRLLVPKEKKPHKRLISWFPHRLTRRKRLLMRRPRRNVCAGWRKERLMPFLPRWMPKHEVYTRC